MLQSTALPARSYSVPREGQSVLRFIHAMGNPWMAMPATSRVITKIILFFFNSSTDSGGQVSYFTRSRLKKKKKKIKSFIITFHSDGDSKYYNKYYNRLKSWLHLKNYTVLVTFFNGCASTLCFSGEDGNIFLLFFSWSFYGFYSYQWPKMLALNKIPCVLTSGSTAQTLTTETLTTSCKEVLASWLFYRH